MKDVVLYQQIMPEYDGMIWKIAQKYYFDTTKFSFEDLLNEGRLATLKAKEKIPSNIECKESTYVYNAVRLAILDFTRSNRYDLSVTKYEQEKQYNTNGNTDELKKDAIAKREDKTLKTNHEEYELDFFNIIASGEPPPLDKLIREESIEILKEEMNTLPERDRAILEAFYNGEKLNTIASHYNVSTQRVGQIKDRAFEKLSSQMKKRYAGALS